MMINKKYIVLAAVFIGSALQAQKPADTTALIKEFSKVMAFSAQPYLYYTTATRMTAEPVIEQMDTLNITGEFYKHNTEIYANNSGEEMYLQDSLMIEVNHNRKSVLVRKVDVATKANLNVLPVNSKEILEHFKKSYSISKSMLSADVSRLSFTGRKQEYSTSSTTTWINVDYSEKTWLPSAIEMIIELKQPADEEMIAAMQAEGMDETKLVKMIDGIRQVFRKQVVRISFISIGNDREKTAAIPSYKAGFDFDAGRMEFTGKGKYKDYEITMMF